LLRTAPRVVVAPVGVGFGQQALARWAQRNHRLVVRDPSGLGREACLFIPQRRRQLESIHLDHPDEGLFLHEADLTYTKGEWLAALGTAREAYAEESYHLSQGWPEGLLIALQLSQRQDAIPLLHHPLAQAHLGRFIPKDVSRDTLSRLASSPLLIPELYDFLGLTPGLVAELYDRGLLYAADQGYRLPALLRRALHQPMPPQRALELAQILASKHLHSPALEILREHRLWEAYLELIVETYAPRSGVQALREHLSQVPPSHRNLEAYEYLTALLRRSSGDIAGAIQRLQSLQQRASPRLQAWVINALGVAYGMQGNYSIAAECFKRGLAQTQVSPVHGRLLHNLGIAQLHLHRYREGAEALAKAASLYRDLGNPVEEAMSAENLANAKVFEGYPLVALAEFSRLSPICPGSLAQVNMGRAYIQLGELEKAKQTLQTARLKASEAGNQRTVKYSEVVQAQVALLEEQPELAYGLASGVLHTTQEADLRREAHLVRSQVEFRRGNLEAAREELAHAANITFSHKTEAVRQGLSPLEPTLEEAREAGATFDVAQLLMLKGDLASLREALSLCQHNGYGLLLQHPFYSHHWLPLIKADPSCWAAFPLSIQTFGGFRVSFLGKTLGLRDFPTKKIAALLLALALHSRPQKREMLAEWLWTELNHPLDSLQNAVSKLRSLFLPQLISSSKHQLSLNFPVVLDYVEFVKQARAFLETPGPGLEDFIQRHSEPWLPELAELFPLERSEVERYQHELWATLAEQQQGENTSLALVAYRHALALDPYSERAWQGLIAAYEKLDNPEMAAKARRSMAEALRELRG
jgi:DNA-binding SARP family transcriptional activator